MRMFNKKHQNVFYHVSYRHNNLLHTGIKMDCVRSTILKSKLKLASTMVIKHTELCAAISVEGCCYHTERINTFLQHSPFMQECNLHREIPPKNTVSHNFNHFFMVK